MLIPNSTKTLLPEDISGTGLVILMITKTHGLIKYAFQNRRYVYILFDVKDVYINGKFCRNSDEMCKDLKKNIILNFIARKIHVNTIYKKSVKNNFLVNYDWYEANMAWIGLRPSKKVTVTNDVLIKHETVKMLKLLSVLIMNHYIHLYSSEKLEEACVIYNNLGKASIIGKEGQVVKILSGSSGILSIQGTSTTIQVLFEISSLFIDCKKCSDKQSLQNLVKEGSRLYCNAIENINIHLGTKFIATCVWIGMKPSLYDRFIDYTCKNVNISCIDFARVYYGEVVNISSPDAAIISVIINKKKVSVVLPLGALRPRIDKGRISETDVIQNYLDVGDFIGLKFQPKSCNALTWCLAEDAWLLNTLQLNGNVYVLFSSVAKKLLSNICNINMLNTALINLLQTSTCTKYSNEFNEKCSLPCQNTGLCSTGKLSREKEKSSNYAKNDMGSTVGNSSTRLVYNKDGFVLKYIDIMSLSHLNDIPCVLKSIICSSMGMLEIVPGVEASFSICDLFINGEPIDVSIDLATIFTEGINLMCIASKVKSGYLENSSHIATCVWLGRKPTISTRVSKYFAPSHCADFLAENGFYIAKTVAIAAPSVAVAQVQDKKEMVPVIIFVQNIWKSDKEKTEHIEWINDYLKVNDILEIKIRKLRNSFRSDECGKGIFWEASDVWRKSIIKESILKHHFSKPLSEKEKPITIYNESDTYKKLHHLWVQEIIQQSHEIDITAENSYETDRNSSVDMNNAFKTNTESPKIDQEPSGSRDNYNILPLQSNTEQVVTTERDLYDRKKSENVQTCNDFQYTPIVQQAAWYSLDFEKYPKESVELKHNQSPPDRVKLNKSRKYVTSHYVADGKRGEMIGKHQCSTKDIIIFQRSFQSLKKLHRTYPKILKVSDEKLPTIPEDEFLLSTKEQYIDCKAPLKSNLKKSKFQSLIDGQNIVEATIKIPDIINDDLLSHKKTDNVCMSNDRFPSFTEGIVSSLLDQFVFIEFIKEDKKELAVFSINSSGKTEKQLFPKTNVKFIVKPLAKPFCDAKYEAVSVLVNDQEIFCDQLHFKTDDIVETNTSTSKCVKCYQHFSNCKMTRKKNEVSNKYSTMKGLVGRVKRYLNQTDGFIELNLDGKLIELPFCKQVVQTANLHRKQNIQEYLLTGKEVNIDIHQDENNMYHITNVWKGKKSRKQNSKSVSGIVDMIACTLLQNVIYRAEVTELRFPFAFIAEIHYQSNIYKVFVFSRAFRPTQFSCKLQANHPVTPYVDRGDTILLLVQRNSPDQEFEWIAKEAWKEDERNETIKHVSVAQYSYDSPRYEDNQGMLATLQSDCGMLTTINGEEMIFSSDNAYLYGVPLGEMNLKNIYRIDSAFADIFCCARLLPGRYNAGFLQSNTWIPKVASNQDGCKLSYRLLEPTENNIVTVVWIGEDPHTYEHIGCDVIRNVDLYRYCMDNCISEKILIEIMEKLNDLRVIDIDEEATVLKEKYYKPDSLIPESLCEFNYYNFEMPSYDDFIKHTIWASQFQTMYSKNDKPVINRNDETKFITYKIKNIVHSDNHHFKDRIADTNNTAVNFTQDLPRIVHVKLGETDPTDHPVQLVSLEVPKSVLQDVLILLNSLLFGSAHINLEVHMVRDIMNCNRNLIKSLMFAFSEVYIPVKNTFLECNKKLSLVSHCLNCELLVFVVYLNSEHLQSTDEKKKFSVTGSIPKTESDRICIYQSKEPFHLDKSTQTNISSLEIINLIGLRSLFE